MGILLKQLSDTDSTPSCSYVLNAGSTLVGRCHNCSLILSSQSVSRWHCILDVASDAIHVTDLHSLNGTYVNDRRIIRQRLEDDDRLRIGEVPFLLSIDSAQRPPIPSEALALPAPHDDPVKLPHELTPTDFSAITPPPLRSKKRSRVPSRKPPEKSSYLPVPAVAQKLDRYEKSLEGCSDQLRILIEKIAALEAKLNVVASQKLQTGPQFELAPGKAFERHDALMYVARAAVCDKLRQKNVSSTTASR